MVRPNNNQLLPATATAGLSFAASIALDAYPSPQWSAKLLLRGPSVIDLDAVSAGSVQTFTVDRDVTIAWLPGAYWWSLRVQSAAETREVANGQIEILPDFAGLPAGFDGRTQAEIGLDAIKAVLAKRATQDQQRYTIDNRELWRTPIPDLLKLRAAYQSEVSRERAKAAGRSRFGRVIAVRFH